MWTLRLVVNGINEKKSWKHHQLKMHWKICIKFIWNIFLMKSNIWWNIILSRANPADAEIVDVDKIYCEYVDEQIQLRRQKIGPKSLQLKEFEINLRRYRIISGVYRLEYLEQPEQDTQLQTNFFLRTCNLELDILSTIFDNFFFQQRKQIFWNEKHFFNIFGCLHHWRLELVDCPKRLRRRWKWSRKVWVNWHQ